MSVSFLAYFSLLPMESLVPPVVSLSLQSPETATAFGRLTLFFLTPHLFLPCLAIKYLVI